MAIGSGIGAQFGLAREVYTNEVQSISGTPSGVFGLTFDGANTVTTLATTATAPAIQAALEALPNVGTGGVVCTGGPLPTAVTVTFSGPLVQKRNVPQLTVQGAVTGLAFATTTPGTGYGDPVTPSRFLEFVSDGIKLNVDHIESSAIRTGNRVLRADRQTVNRKDATGQIVFEVANKGFGLLLAEMLGKDAVITTPPGGTISRLHTHTMGDPYNRSLTMQFGGPDTGGTVRTFTYKGVKIPEWELSCGLGEFLKLTVGVDAQDEDTTIGLAAAVYPAGQEILSFTGGRIQLAGGNFDARSISLKMGQGLNVNRQFIRSNTLKKEPILGAMAELSGSIEAEFMSLTEYNRYVAGSTAQLIATFTGSIIESAIPYMLRVTLPAVRFDGETPNVDGMDIITQPLPFKVLNDTVNEPIIVEYQTTDIAS